MLKFLSNFVFDLKVWIDWVSDTQTVGRVRRGHSVCDLILQVKNQGSTRFSISAVRISRLLFKRSSGMSLSWYKDKETSDEKKTRNIWDVRLFSAGSDRMKTKSLPVSSTFTGSRLTPNDPKKVSVRLPNKGGARVFYFFYPWNGNSQTGGFSSLISNKKRLVLFCYTVFITVFIVYQRAFWRCI